MERIWRTCPQLNVVLSVVMLICDPLSCMCFLSFCSPLFVAMFSDMILNLFFDASIIITLNLWNLFNQQTVLMITGRMQTLIEISRSRVQRTEGMVVYGSLLIFFGWKLLNWFLVSYNIRFCWLLDLFLDASQCLLAYALW